MSRKLFLTIAFIGIFIFACGYEQKLKAGNETVAKIEKFRNEKGRLPNSLNGIGIVEDESGSIYYRKEGDAKYIVWFGKSLGESATYDSDTKKWDNL